MNSAQLPYSFIKKNNGIILLQAIAICILAFYMNNAAAKPFTTDTVPPSFYRGADLSFSPMLEDEQQVFFDGDKPMSTLDIFKSNGCNLVRLRLWHTPNGKNSSVQEVLAYAKRVKAAGMSILLDFHYADNWADIMKQPIPKAWAQLNKKDMQDSLYKYTYHTIALFIANGVVPDIVQIGNEVNSGILWGAGNVSDSSENNWPYFTTLLKTGIKAVKDADKKNRIKILIQYANLKGADRFFKRMSTYKVNYNIMGISFYPFAPTNDMDQLQKTLSSLTQKYKKNVLITETVYPFTLASNSQAKLSLGENAKLVKNMDATPEGQKNYLLELRKRLKAIPNHRGIGFCYWAPDWVAYKGDKKAPYQSPWVNLTLFDFDHKALPALKAFNQYAN
jgi:arabinogalactan endo-1,4-beta-galactosidase